MASEDTIWLVWFSLGGESHHLMKMQSSQNQVEVEAAFERMASAHRSAYPNLPMKIERLERLDPRHFVEQADKALTELKAKYPNQRFADELYPENPNHLLFPPLNNHSLLGDDGSEESLVRWLCDGNWR